MMLDDLEGAQVELYSKAKPQNFSKDHHSLMRKLRHGRGDNVSDSDRSSKTNQNQSGSPVSSDGASSVEPSLHQVNFNHDSIMEENCCMKD